MQTSLVVPRILQSYINHQSGVRLSGDTVEEVLADLRSTHPKLYQCLCQETGRLRKHIHLFVNNDLIDPNSLAQPLKCGDVISIFQAVSGG